MWRELKHVAGKKNLQLQYLNTTNCVKSACWRSSTVYSRHIIVNGFEEGSFLVSSQSLVSEEKTISNLKHDVHLSTARLGRGNVLVQLEAVVRMSKRAPVPNWR